ncbi:MAG TPA: cyclopropane-fatty-acyl-phospholipid synthase family protein [Gammaproteobacteria bacterium]|nr:cyclopropane-fatty-acyl-phospholipid synthase family protein [Gammaproteobacteria bacterium]
MSVNMNFGNEVAQHRADKASSQHPAARLASIDLSDTFPQAPHSTSSVTAVDRWIARKMMAVVGNPPIVLKLWDGTEVTAAEPYPVARLQYHSRSAMLKTIINPELYFGDIYANGEASIEGDLIRFTEIIFSNLGGKVEKSWLRNLVLWLQHRRIANSFDKAKDNIYHHYDIGNDFYRLWLDRAEMQYTCAYFPDQAMTLEQAQVAKLHHVCRKLELKAGEEVVEAGCGWGGLALFMAKHYGVRVTAYNISREQVAYARSRAEREGLSERIEYVLDDYRNIRGEYDAFVSVGMLEHVGTRDYAILGDVINRCLKPTGRGLIHSIGRNRAEPMNAWIERRVFPGAYPPSLKEMMAIFEPNHLSVLDVENLRLHYSLTLQHWLARYEQHSAEIREMMDETFVRTWRLYLAGSIAAFNVGELQLFQVVFSREQNNQLPWSRAHLYPQTAPKTTIPEPEEEPAEA